MSQFIFANIKIPIEITREREFNYLNEYAQISFEKCFQLPKRQNADINQLLNNMIDNYKQTEIEETETPIRIKISDANNSVQESNIQPFENEKNIEYSNESEDDDENEDDNSEDVSSDNNTYNEPRVTVEEIMKKKRNKSYNTSFKSKKYNSKKYSVKNLKN
jgi:hypothetical protein